MKSKEEKWGRKIEEGRELDEKREKGSMISPTLNQ